MAIVQTLVKIISLLKTIRQIWYYMDITLIVNSVLSWDIKGSELETYIQFKHTSPIKSMLKKCGISNNNSQF